MILNICDNSNILKIVRFAKVIIDVIKIAVPILLILSLSIEYMKAVRKDDADLLAKANKNAIRKGIAAILIFLIPTFVGITLKLSNPEPQTPFACLRDATMSNINAAAIKEARAAIDVAKESLERSDYTAARKALDNVTSSEKQQLESELSLILDYIKIKEAINQLKVKYDENLYKNITDTIKKIKDKEVQDKLYKLLEEAGKGRPLDVQEGAHSGRSSNLSYITYVPEKVTTNMPLILYLHGDGGSGSSCPLYTQAVKFFGKNFPFIIVAPTGGMWAETGGRLAEVKSIVEAECQKYSCDKSKISVTGHSRGSIGTWHIVNNYPGFFHKAVPISCGSYSLNFKNFLQTPVRAFAGTSGENEARYNREMSANVSNIKKVGGDATFTSLQGKNHGTSVAAALTQETILWMIE